jgi:dUTP pyrophosphatase
MITSIDNYGGYSFMDKIYIKKLKAEAILPTRANPSDAGADVYFCSHEPLTIAPGESVLLGTGLQVATPIGYVCEVKNRSGMAYKKSLVVGSCVIDSGYSGEVKVNLHNIGREVRTIDPFEKIAQLVFYQVNLPTFECLPNEVDLYLHTPTVSSRGEGGFGSTGSK